MHSEAQAIARETVGPLPEAVKAVAAAAEQIAVALREAQQPVEQLGASVSRIIVTVGSLRSASEDLADPGRRAQVREQISRAISGLSQDAAQATVTLQFYDRLTQHLSHLHDYLAGVSELLSGKETATDPGRETHDWSELRDKLSRRLMSDLQRQHLQRMDPVEWGANAIADTDSVLRSPRSSVELF